MQSPRMIWVIYEWYRWRPWPSTLNVYAGYVLSKENLLSGSWLKNILRIMMVHIMIHDSTVTGYNQTKSIEWWVTHNVSHSVCKWCNFGPNQERLYGHQWSTSHSIIRFSLQCMFALLCCWFYRIHILCSGWTFSWAVMFMQSRNKERERSTLIWSCKAYKADKFFNLLMKESNIYTACGKVWLWVEWQRI